MRGGIWLSLLLATAGCQVTPNSSPRDALPIWEVHDQNGVVAWLAGSVHSLPATAYPLPEPLYEAFARSSMLVVEVDTTRLDQAELAGLVARRGRADKPLQERLTAATWHQLEAWLSARGESPEQFRMMQPWLITLTLSNLVLAELGYSPQLGVDVHLLDRAHVRNKPIAQLESAAFQLELLADAEPVVQERALALGLAELSNLPATMTALTSAWRNGDLARLREIALAGSGADPLLAPLLHRLLDERNAAMAHAVHGFVQAGERPLVLVGALHMAGPSGLVAALSADFDVKQVYRDRQ